MGMGREGEVCGRARDEGEGRVGDLGDEMPLSLS